MRSIRGSVRVREIFRLSFGVLTVFLISLAFYGEGLPKVSDAIATVPSTTTLAISGGGPLELTPPPNVFTSVSETFSVTTTGARGYNFSFMLSSGGSLLHENAPRTIPGITLPSGASSVTSANFPEGFGYSLDNTNYKPIGSGSVDIAETNSANLTPDSYSFSIGVKIGDNVLSGNYKSGIVFSAVAKEVPIYLSYDGNGADAGEMEVTNTNFSVGDEVTLYASNFSRAGYGFAGWNTKADGTGATFGPNETITITSELIANPTVLGEVKLYAKWIQSTGNLQGWEGCPALNAGEVTALRDTRDDEVYAVAKLADGNCWTIENLRLDASNGRVTNFDTNNPTESFVTSVANHTEPHWDECDDVSSEGCAYTTSYSLSNINRNLTANPGGNSQEVSWYSYGGMYNWYTATAGNGVGVTDRNVIIKGDICPRGWYLPNDRTYSGGHSGNFDNLETSLVTPGAWRAYPNNFVLSGRYSRDRALGRGTAGSYWSANGDELSVMGGGETYYESFSVHVNLSYIANGREGKFEGHALRCVAGEASTFNLAYKANGGEFSGGAAEPMETVSGNGLATFTISSTVPTRTGYQFIGWMDEDGNEYHSGDSMTTIEPNSAVYAIWNNLSCNPNATAIATGNSSQDAVCLQDINAAVESSMPSKVTYTLKDARDNKEYTVAKLDDGNVWMTQNLNYAESEDRLLSAHDTDLSSGEAFLAPASSGDFIASSLDASYTTPKILGDDTYGGYYSFAAAVASGKLYTNRVIIETSICPRGWSLPRRERYDNLKAVAGLTTYDLIHAAPYNFIYAGYRDGNNFSFQTSTLRLWTASNLTVNRAYATLAYQNSFVDNKGIGGRSDV